MIEIKNVSLSFKDRKIFENINLVIKKQEAFGIIGPSNEGKSVLLKMIAGILKPTSGTIEVNSKKVSMLFQKNALFDSITVIENLLVPLSETLGIIKEEASERATHMLKAVGLEHAAHLYPNEISGGMQKRLGIGRALIIEPEVILYDEPTAGLDPITSKSIAELMISLHHKNLTTLVMVTNDLQRALQVSDQLVYCNQKTLRKIGSPGEVKASQDHEIKSFIFANSPIRRSELQRRTSSAERT